MKKIVLFILIWLITGCMIRVIPLNDGRIPLPPASSGLEFNTYGSGWGWPFVPYPGVSWGGYGGYQNYGYNLPYQYQYQYRPPPPYPFYSPPYQQYQWAPGYR